LLFGFQATHGRPGTEDIKTAQFEGGKSKMKKLSALLLTMAMVMSLAACSSTPPAGSTPGGSSSSSTPSGSGEATGFENLNPVTLEMADATAVGAAGNLLALAIKEKVEAITGGKMTITYYPNSEMGGDNDILQSVQSGDLDISVGQTAPSANFVSNVAVFDLPMVFAQYDGDTIDTVLNGDGEFRTTLGKDYEAAGFVLLGYMQNATFRLTTSNVKLDTLAAFDKIKIRTMENANHQAFWSALGAAPTPLAWGEVYVSLSNGTIAAQENAADTCVGANLQEVQKYLNLTNHILYLNQVLINKDKFEGLDPAYQAALQQAVNEAIAQMRPQLTQLDETNKQVLENGGMEIVSYDSAFYEEILNLDGVKALYTKIDGDVNGLGTMLQAELAAKAG